MQKRYEEILNDLGYEVMANSSLKEIKSDTILDQIKSSDGSKYLKDNKEMVKITNDSMKVKVFDNTALKASYNEKNSSYTLFYLYPHQDLFSVTFNITKYTKGEMVAKIEMLAKIEKDNKLVNDINYGLVTIEQYPTFANVKYKKGVAHYKEELCNANLFLNIVEDYLNGINEYRDNLDIYKAYKLLVSKYLRKDINSVFEFRDSNIDMYLNNYNEMLLDIDENDIRKSLIKKKINILNNKK